MGRLGHLIVIQVLFVFAALAMILFFPSNNSFGELDLSSVSRDSELLAQEVDSILAEVSIDPVSSDLSQRLTSRLAPLVNLMPAISSVALYAGTPDHRIDMIWSLHSGDLPMPQDAETNVSSPVNLATVKLMTSHERGTHVQQDIAPEHLVQYHRLGIYAETPVVLVTAGRHNLLVSARSDVAYGMMLLFLGSVLVSLLTVYLVYRRFRDPLRKLQEGLTRTSNGEVYHMVEAEGDEEISHLIEAFNEMSQTLFANRRRLEKFNRMIQEAYLSQAEVQVFLSTLIEYSPNSVIAVSLEGEIVIYNRKAVETFGYSVDEAIGMTVDKLFVNAPDKDHLPTLTNESVGVEVICRRKNAEEFPAYLMACSVTSPTGNTSAYLLNLMDITESKSFQEMMVRVDRYYTRGEMAGDIAHEINNFLAVLSGNIELMPLFLKRGDQEKINTKLTLMKSTVDKIANFTDGLMDVNADDIQFDKVDLNQLIQNIIAFLKPQNRFDNITIEADLDSNLSLVELDISQMQQVMVNLLNNAADAVAESEVKEICVRSHLVKDGADKRASIEVIDSGPGVPEDKRPLLFEKRFTTKRKGHGYGLITCRRIIDSHSGQISYDRSERTCFSTVIPIVQSEATGEITTREDMAVISG